MLDLAIICLGCLILGYVWGAARCKQFAEVPHVRARIKKAYITGYQDGAASVLKLFTIDVRKNAAKTGSINGGDSDGKD